MTHAVKTWTNFYKDQEAGKKLFELRKDDRPYNIGDKFLSQEYDQNKNEYTGKENTFIIAYILRDAEMFGLKQGYCILQLEEIDND